MSCPGSWGRGRGWPRSCVCLYRLCVAPGGPVVGSVVGSGVIPPQYIPVSTNHVCKDALSRRCFILRLPGDVYLRGHHSTLMGWAAGCGRLPHGLVPPSTLNPQLGSWAVSWGDSWRLGAARPSAWGARPPAPGLGAPELLPGLPGPRASANPDCEVQPATGTAFRASPPGDSGGRTRRRLGGVWYWELRFRWGLRRGR